MANVIAKAAKIEAQRQAELATQFAAMTDAEISRDLIESMNEIDALDVESRISNNPEQGRWRTIRFEALDRRIIAARAELKKRTGR